MTLLELINQLFLQWFFVRITKCEREKIQLDYTLEVAKDGRFSVFKTKEVLAKKKQEVWYSIQGWIIPCTIHKSPFKHHSKWSIRITSIQEHSQKIKDEKNWEKYLERICYDYCGKPCPPCEPFEEMEVEMTISYGKMIDE